MTRHPGRVRVGLRPPTGPPAPAPGSPGGAAPVPIELEREIQRRLAAHPDLWGFVGWPAVTLLGQEFRLPTRGRADLVYEQFRGSQRRAVVVEIKRGVVDDSAVSQVLRYRGWIDAGAAGRFPRPSQAILVGEALDDEAARRVSATARLTFVPLAALGIASTSRFRRSGGPARSGESLKRSPRRPVGGLLGREHRGADSYGWLEPESIGIPSIA